MKLYIPKFTFVLTNLFTNALLCLNLTHLLVKHKLRLEVSSLSK